MPTENKYLYHLTHRLSVCSIFINGLQPRLGKNCQSIDDQRKAIFLCRLEDIKYWQIIFPELTEVIMVDVSDIPEDQIKEYKYSYYNEYAVSCIIPPEKLSTPRAFAMINMCKSILVSISIFCHMCTVHYNDTNPSEDRLERILQLGREIITILPRLDFKFQPDQFWSAYIREYANGGEYAFSDTYDGTEQKLYEKLTDYPADNTLPYRQIIRDYITLNFSWAKTIDTGGWLNLWKSEENEANDD